MAWSALGYGHGMSLLLQHAPDDESAKWKEEHLQAHIAVWLRKMQRAGLLRFAVGMEGVRLGKVAAGKAKVQGMEKGLPDLRIFMDGPEVAFIELKLDGNGTSNEQDECHHDLANFGFQVFVVSAKTPAEALGYVQEVLGYKGFDVDALDEGDDIDE